MDRKGFDVSISYYDKPRYNAKHGIVRIAFSIECTSRLGSFVTYFIRDNKLFFIKDITQQILIFQKERIQQDSYG